MNYVHALLFITLILYKSFLSQGIYYRIFRECCWICKKYQILIIGTIFIADAHAVVKSQLCHFKRCPIQMNHFHLQFHCQLFTR